VPTISLNPSYLNWAFRKVARAVLPVERYYQISRLLRRRLEIRRSLSPASIRAFSALIDRTPPRLYDVIYFAGRDQCSPSEALPAWLSAFAEAGHRVFYVAPAFRASGEAYEVRPRGVNLYEVSLRGPERNASPEAPEVMDDQTREALFASLNALRRDLSFGATAAFVQSPYWSPLVKQARADLAWPIVYDRLSHQPIASEGPSAADDWPPMADLVLNPLDPEFTWPGAFAEVAPQVREAFPKVSIVIVTYNNLALNRLCLKSLYAHTEWPNFEVIVVDNASTDKTPGYLKEAAHTFPHLTVILNDRNLGFAAGNNLGLKRASGEYLVLLNNDTVVPHGWLAALIRHLAADPQIGLLGPVTNEIGNEAKIPVGYKRLEDMPAWAAHHMRENDGRLFPIPMPAMFCVALRREVFEKVGLLDDRFGIGMFEDDDYARRIREAGYQLVCARDAFVYHLGGASFKRLTDQKYYEIFQRNRALYEQKWGEMWQPHSDNKERLRIPGLRERLREIVKGSGIDPRRVVVFLPTIGWHNCLPQRPHHLATALARQGYLVFFDCSGSLVDHFAGFMPVEQNLWLYHGPKGVLETLDHPILWAVTYNAPLADRWEQRTLIYDWIDDLSVFPYNLERLERNHRRMLKEADLVLCVARGLINQSNGVRPDILYLPNGVEHERFSSPSGSVGLSSRFRRIVRQGRPVVGYYGAVASWLDVELLTEVARLRPDWSFLLIGHQLPDAPSLKPLQGLANVLVLTAQKYETLPHYLAPWTAAMIPFKVNQITQATSPLKLYEYFAGGKPVISTPMPECQAFPEVHVIRDAREFSAALDLAAAQSRDASFPEHLRAVARENSWAARVQTVIEHLPDRAEKEGEGTPLLLA